MKITIITVCFNSQQTIKATIKSVLNQSYKGFNNGSRDYYDKFVNPSVYKNGYIKLFS